METVKSFLAKYNITTHTIAGGIATLALLYASVPQFHELVYEGFQHSPAWLHKTITAAVGIYAFYHKSDTTTPPAGEVK